MRWFELFYRVPYHLRDSRRGDVHTDSPSTARTVKGLNCDFRLALSGTPLENNLGELYSLFSFLNPALFKSEAEFERDYLNPIQKQQDSVAAEDLKRKIRPFILRRLKRDVLDDLPDKIEQTLYVDMEPEQKKTLRTASHILP